VADGGDYVTPGVWLTGDQLGLFQDGRAQLLYVECLEFSQTLGDLTIALEELSGGPSDRVRLTCSPLVAFDVLPGEDYDVSADHARIVVGASVEYVPDEDRPLRRLPYGAGSVRWAIASGQGGSLEHEVTGVHATAGLAGVGLRTTTLAGATYTVRGALENVSGLVRFLTPATGVTATLQVEPGAPPSIALTQSKRAVKADGTDIVMTSAGSIRPSPNPTGGC